MKTMLIRDTDWELVREHFTEEEKQALRDCVTGQTLCPAGFTMDIEKAGEPGKKLARLIEERKKI